MSNRIRQAQRTLDVVRQAVGQSVENGAEVRYSSGVVLESSGYYCSAYLNASDYASDYIRLTSGQFVSSGDYVLVAELGVDSWVEQILPHSMYSKMVIDAESSRIGLGGSGDSDDWDFGTAGWALLSGGPGSSAYWGLITGGGGGSGLGDHDHSADSTEGGERLAPVDFIVPISASPFQTEDGNLKWDTTYKVLTIGDGTSKRLIGLLSDVAPSTQAFGDSADAGTSAFSSRRDHKHAMPADPTTGSMDGNARVAVEKNGTVVGTRRAINFIEGSNITLTVADDSGSEEVDVTIASSGGGGVSDGDKGDVVVSGSGTVWTVEDDSHTHTSSTVTPAGIGAATSGHNHDGAYEAAGAVATHAGLSDPHTGYQKESEKGVANGYPELDSGGEIPWAQVPLEMVKVESNETNTTTSATDSSIAFDVAANEILNIVIYGWYNRGPGTNSATSVQIKLSGPQSAGQRGQISWTTTNTDWNVEDANSFDTNFPAAGMIANNGNSARFFRLDARISNGGTAQTITMQFKRTGGSAGDQVAIVAGTSAIAY